MEYYFDACSLFNDCFRVWQREGHIYGGRNRQHHPFRFALCLWGKKNPYGIMIAMVLKYLSQVLSGVYFWFPEGSAAGSAAAWAFSLSYNLWYNVVTMIICVILVPLLVETLRKANIGKA